MAMFVGTRDGIIRALSDPFVGHIMQRISILSLALFVSLFCQAQQNTGPYTFEKCIEIALQNSIDAESATLNTELIKIGLKQDQMAFLPTVNASGGYGVNIGRTIDPFTNQFATNSVQSGSIGAGVGATLYNGLQNQNRYKRSQVDVKRAEADEAAAENTIALGVSNAFLTVVLNKEFINIAQSNLVGSSAQVDRIRQLVDAGSVPEGSLFEIQAQMARDEASLQQAQNNHDLALLNLAQLLNIDPASWDQFSVVVPSIPQPSATGLPADINTLTQTALSSFPQVKSATLSQESAEYGIQIARGAFQPRLSASYNVGSGYSGARLVGVGEPVLETFQIGVVSSTLDPVISAQSTFSQFETPSIIDQFEDNINQSVFLNLSIPIFNGLAARSNVQRAEIGLRQAQLAANSTELQLRQEIARAYADAQVALKNFQAAQKSIEANQRAFDYAKVRYEAGVTNATDFNDARVLLDVAKADVLRLKYDYFFRLKVLDFYAGKPLTLTP